MYRKNTFFVHFQTFFSDFRREITEKGLKSRKRVENGWKKHFDQLLGACSTRKLVKIHNTLIYNFFMRPKMCLSSKKFYFKTSKTHCNRVFGFKWNTYLHIQLMDFLNWVLDTIQSFPFWKIWRCSTFRVVWILNFIGYESF